MRLTSNHSPWSASKNYQIKSTALLQCQCMRIQYGRHWGWFKKAVGSLLILISATALIWIEKRAVENSRSYHDGMQAVTNVFAADDILEENEGKLIHVSGYLRIYEPLEDLPYGVSIPAVKLKRRVQMFQWIEERTSPDSPLESVRYEKAWKDKLLDSSKFKIPKGHNNPKYMPLQSMLRVNPHVYLGKYKLGPELKDKFSTFVPFTSGERPETQEMKMHMGLYFHSADIWNPAVGDVRVQFSFAGAADTYVTIVARQNGGELRPFVTKSGATIAYIHDGKKHPEEVFHKEHSTVAYKSWICRVVTFGTSVFGTFMASRIIALLNHRNPVVRNLMYMGPRKFSLVTALFICLSITGSIWVFHKPLFGLLLVIFSCCLILYYALTGPDAPNSNSNLSLPQYTRVQDAEVPMPSREP